jgi:hypothetical protein
MNGPWSNPSVEMHDVPNEANEEEEAVDDDALRAARQAGARKADFGERPA